MATFNDQREWQAALRREYPSVQFEDANTHPPGVNAVCEGVLVGRFYSSANPPYGVLYDQPRSCGGR